MATLYSQPPRQDALRLYMNSISEALEIMQVPEGRKPTPAEWHAACDITRTALAIQSGDVLDEQLMGFAEILSRLAARS